MYQVVTICHIQIELTVEKQFKELEALYARRIEIAYIEAIL
jgi:hypothetical protein